MKAYLVVALFLVAFAVETSAAAIGHAESSHIMLKRETIQGPAFPNRCVFYECIASCRNRGYKSGGYCTINGCQYHVGSESPEAQNERSCNQRACDQLCRRLTLGGACVNGRCKCDNFFGTGDTIDVYSGLGEIRICRLKKCNETCTRRGYEGAKCINGHCKCYNKKQKVDASPLNEVTSDENEESNKILRTNEGMLSDGVWNIINNDVGSELPEAQNERGCNQRVCDQLCRSLKLLVLSGACVNGRCKCDNSIGSEDASPLNEVTSDKNEKSNEILRTIEEVLTGGVCNFINSNNDNVYNIYVYT